MRILPGNRRGGRFRIRILTNHSEDRRLAGLWSRSGRDPSFAAGANQHHQRKSSAARLDLSHWRKGPVVRGDADLRRRRPHIFRRRIKTSCPDPETGKEIWKYTNPKPSGSESRGVAYWAGDKPNPPRILFGTGDGAAAGAGREDRRTRVPTFGTDGSIDLRAGVADNYPNAHFAISSPPVIYRDVVIVGPSTQEAGSVGPGGDPRGFDVRTGKLLWSFHTVPRPGEPGNDTWGTNGWKDRAGPSQWGLDTVDTERGLVFLPVGNAADSFYGGDREGTDLYANSVVALDALTGKLRWYYQMVHHDLWDYDMNAPPALIDVKHNGEVIPALAETNKMSLLFILDRRTGKPIYGVEERPVPKGDIPGEWYSPTEPFPLKPPPLSRMTMTMDDVSKRTPEAEKFCGEWFSRLRSQGALYALRFDRLVIDAGNHGRRKLGRRLLRSGAWLHLREHQQPGHCRANGADGGRFSSALSQPGRLHSLH